MSSNYYDMRDAKVSICHELMNRGWKIYDYKKDESDSMTDYYSPANWGGIATKNGYVLVVDKRWDSDSGKEIKKYNPKGNLSINDRNKIEKLKEIRTDRGATEGEETNAKEMIKRIEEKISGVAAYEVIDKYPEFMVNPGRCKWHIEKDGKIYDKGTGLTKYHNLPSSWQFDFQKMEWKSGHNKLWEWTEEGRITVPRQVSEETKKLVTNFNNLIQRFENIVAGVTTMGDGTEETEHEGLKAKQSEGMKKIIEKVTKKVWKMVEVKRDYIKEGDYLTLSYHGHYWLVTREYMKKGTWKGIEKMKKAFNYEIVGAASRGYKQLKNPKGYYQYEERMLKDLQEGKIKIYELKHVEEVQEVEKWVKIDNNSNKKTTSKKETKKETKEESKNNNESSNQKFTIEKTKHTKTNADIWVCKLINKVSKEEFKTILKDIKSKGGYYSKFVHGFVFNTDPTELLNNNSQKATAPEEKKEDTYNTEIKDNHIYNAHFKEWNYTVDELKTEVDKMNFGIRFNYNIVHDKIFFNRVTAEQAKQLKELSNKNGSIFFVDWEISEKEFESIEDKAKNLLDTSTTIIEKLELNHTNYYYNKDYETMLFDYVKEKYTKEDLQNIIDYLGNEYSTLQGVLNTFVKEYNRIENTNFDKIIQKIDKNIESFEKKLDSISGDYKTNTWKRMKEEESREGNRQFYRQEIKILEYLREKATNETITEFEIHLLTNTFRDDIRSHRSRTKHNKMVKYPSISEVRAEWAKEEARKEIKRLQKANINNYIELERAINQYNKIIEAIDNPEDKTKVKIKKLENQYKMQQKGDINFTPSEIVEKMIHLADIDNNSRVLEPSAGIGHIADKVKEITQNVDCIERMYSYEELLKLKGHNVVGNDFLQYNKYNYYNVVLMNPPFSKNQDIEHVKHAYKMLKTGGKLVAITSPHWTFANDKQSQEFREWIEDKMEYNIDLESGTFEMTNVRSKIIVLEKLEETMANAI